MHYFAARISGQLDDTDMQHIRHGVNYGRAMDSRMLSVESSYSFLINYVERCDEVIVRPGARVVHCEQVACSTTNHFTARHRLQPRSLLGIFDRDR